MTLSRRILKELGSSPIPISTPTLVLLTAFGKSNPRGRVWSVLSRLRRAGVVEKCGTGKFPGDRRTVTATLWRLASGGQK